MIGNAAYVESRILSANPIELVAILYEHAILYTGQARESLARKDIHTRSARIARVISIIGELDGSLNHAAGGEISLNLARLYQYMRERLVTANLKQEDAPLAEVERLLTTLSEAWSRVAHEPEAPVYQMGPAPVSHVWTA
jgi:flagellar protein FliS